MRESFVSAFLDDLLEDEAVLTAAFKIRDGISHVSNNIGCLCFVSVQIHEVFASRLKRSFLQKQFEHFILFL